MTAVQSFDYVVVGAGSAGCVLAYRLSEDPSISVALIEAGPEDRSPFIHMPRGLTQVMADPKHIWAFSSVPHACTSMNSETWVRGRVLGGSSAINGMMYVRGQPADYDGIAAVSSDDWNWRNMSRAFQAIENHELGAGEERGTNGPLKLSLPRTRTRLTESVIAAAAGLGLPVKHDVNAPDNGEGVGYAPCTVHAGRRQTSAVAFLKPARKRPNLTVITDAVADKIIFENKRAVAVEYLNGGTRKRVGARRELIVAGGAMSSPGVLERSGIGNPDLLDRLGIPVVHANPSVGEHLIEHRGIAMQWRLKRYSQNREFFGWRLLRNVSRYFLTHGGPMSHAAYEMGVWFKTQPGLARPNGQFLVATFSLDPAAKSPTPERLPGMHIILYPLRPKSKGRVHIQSLDPNAAAPFEPNYHGVEEDRRELIDVLRYARRFADQPAMREHIESETVPGAQFQTDEQILDAFDRLGTCCYHAVGSCRMGTDPESVVDPQLRVRGVTGLRVMDTSIMPIIPSGNTNGPTMAMAWRAADLILGV